MMSDDRLADMQRLALACPDCDEDKGLLWIRQDDGRWATGLGSIPHEAAYFLGRAKDDVLWLIEENRRLRERVAELERIETGVRRMIEELTPHV